MLNIQNMHGFPNDASADRGTQGGKIRCSGLATVLKGIIPIAEKKRLPAYQAKT